MKSIFTYSLHERNMDRFLDSVSMERKTIIAFFRHRNVNKYSDFHGLGFSAVGQELHPFEAMTPRITARSD